MLVLSRRKDEEIIITLPDSRTIRVKVCDIGWPKVRVGVEAPADVGIDRREIWEDKREHRN